MNDHDHEHSDDCNICVKARMNAAMLLLAEVELHGDKGGFPVALGERIKKLCNAHFGDVRPSFQEKS